MSEEDALNLTKKRFTNILDGKVRPGVSVNDIISYYKDLLASKKPNTKLPMGNIEQRFLEDRLDDEYKDMDY